MRPAALLQDRDGLTHLSAVLEIAHQHHRIGQIARIDRRLHLHTDQAMLRTDQERCNTGLAKVGQQLVQLDEALTRMGTIDARLLRVAEMRIIMGMDIATIALALDLSEPTVKRDWQRSKAFLQEALGAPG